MPGKFPFAVESLESLVVRKKNGSSLSIVPWSGGVTNPLISFVLKESIYEPLITGQMVIRESGLWFQQNNLNAFDEVVVTLKGQESSGTLNMADSRTSTTKTYNFVFDITNVKNTLDLALNDFQSYNEDIKSLTIEFVSQSILNKEFIGSILENENFIGPIFANESHKFDLNGSEPVGVELKGFNQYINDKLGIKIDGDDTWNYCYLKKNNVSYPWGKIKGQPTILQTMQYLSEHAVDLKNNAAVNYLFWQDFNGYHFKSIESLIKNQDDEPKTFVMGRGNLLSNRIHNFYTTSEFDFLNLLNSKIYFSWYERILPNYRDPYLDFIDTSLGLTRQNIVFDLTKEYSKTSHIETGSIIPSGLKYESSYTNLAQSHRIDDDVYGFFSKNRYNTPFAQSWEYLGLSADTRLSNVVWQNQFDIDDEVYPEFLYAYDKLIKKNLAKNREDYAKLRNIKKKWEVYRCTVCCTEQIGGTADQAILKNLNSSDYLYYFGPTGAFKDLSNEYGVVAAGSFSDVVNYDMGITSGNGLTLSYNLNSYPYNQSIAQFYNLKTDLENVNKYIDNALTGYVVELNKVQTFIPQVENFIANVNGWISAATDFAYTNLTPGFKKQCHEECEEDNDGDSHEIGAPGNTTCCNEIYGCIPCTAYGAYEYPTSSEQLYYRFSQYGGDEMRFDFGIASCGVMRLPLYVNLRYNSYDQFPVTFTGHWDSFVKYNSYTGSNYPYYVSKLQKELENADVPCPNLIDGPRAFELPFQKPTFLYECTKSKLLTGKYFTTHEYGEFTEFDVNDESSWLNQDLLNAVNDEKVWCETCLDPVALQLAKNEYQKILKELKLKQYVLNELISKLTLLKPIYQQRYQEFLNRKAFFISKNPFDPEVPGNILNKKSQLSLHNIKSIKRKPIRGSRYEILANRVGITSGVGTYVYNVFFDDNVGRRTGITGNHPYYDQKFKGFSGGNYATKPGFNAYKLDFKDFYYYDDQFIDFVGVPGLKIESLPKDKGGFLIYDSVDIQYPKPHTVDENGTLSNYFINGEQDLTNYTKRLNQFNSTSTKIPSLEKEKISSYVRIEFINPIGLDRLSDFPTGFIRDAGSEYFLPYIVQLTDGPNGRQTIQNNAVVIGIDPYGFDVAVKKNRVKNNYTDYKEWGNYWWHIPLNKLRLGNKTKDINDLSLWAETSFENEYTYFQNNGEYVYNIGDDYTEFDFYSGAIGGIFKNGYNYQRGGFYPKGSDSTYYSRLNQAIENISDPSSYFISTDDVYNSSATIQISKNLDTRTINQAKYGSYNLIGSHLHFNSRRSWYDFSYPSKIQFDALLKNIANYNNLQQSSYYINAPQTLLKGNDFIAFGGNDFINNLQNSIKLKNTSALNSFLNSNEITNLHTSDIFEISQLEHIKGISSSNSIFSDDIQRYLNGDLLLYRPGLVTSQIWKYDIFGESEYGLTSPPTLPPEYDLFDNNFAAQFVVFGRSNGSAICKDLNLKCANPKGSVDNSACPESDPYCNCPAKNLMPKESEPSYKQLAQLYENTKECTLIEKYLGKDFLGCMLSDPDNVASCNCPEQGKYYPTFLNMIRSNATFYVTPPKTPLRRQAQMSLFNAQKAIMTIFPDDSLHIGQIIHVERPVSITTQDRISGHWMIVGINRVFKSTNIEVMNVVLARDSIINTHPSSEGESTTSYTRQQQIANNLQ